MNNLLAILGMVAILSFGRQFLLPIITATFLWYLTHAIAAYYEKIIKSRIVSNLLSGASLLGILYLFITQVHPMLSEIYKKMPEITAGIDKTLQSLSVFLGIENAFDNLPSFQSVMTSVGSSIASISTAFGIIIIYMLFMFIEQSTFAEKLHKLFPEKKQFTKMNFILKSIDLHMRKYIFIKTGISLTTALCTYIMLLYFNVDFAGVWAFLTFVLNYIPTFGPITSGALPMVYVFAITGNVHTPVMLGIGSLIINVIFGNLIEPKLTGHSLHLSTLAILVNMVFWGFVWGPLGMFFSVPILVMVFVASAQFDKTRWIAILLSADGLIPNKNEE